MRISGSMKLEDLLEPAQEATDVGLGGGERYPGYPDRAVERMGDRAVGGDHEITAELGLAPHHDTDRITRVRTACCASLR